MGGMLGHVMWPADERGESDVAELSSSESEVEARPATRARAGAHCASGPGGLAYNNRLSWVESGVCSSLPEASRLSCPCNDTIFVEPSACSPEPSPPRPAIALASYASMPYLSATRDGPGAAVGGPATGGPGASQPLDHSLASEYCRYLAGVLPPSSGVGSCVQDLASGVTSGPSPAAAGSSCCGASAAWPRPTCHTGPPAGCASGPYGSSPSPPDGRAGYPSGLPLAASGGCSGFAAASAASGTPRWSQPMAVPVPGALSTRSGSAPMACGEEPWAALRRRSSMGQCSSDAPCVPPGGLVGERLSRGSSVDPAPASLPVGAAATCVGAGVRLSCGRGSPPLRGFASRSVGGAAEGAMAMAVATAAAAAAPGRLPPRGPTGSSPPAALGGSGSWGSGGGGLGPLSAEELLSRLSSSLSLTAGSARAACATGGERARQRARRRQAAAAVVAAQPSQAAGVAVAPPGGFAAAAGSLGCAGPSFPGGWTQPGAGGWTQPGAGGALCHSANGSGSGRQVAAAAWPGGAGSPFAAAAPAGAAVGASQAWHMSQQGC
jgi:hypothetical protein